MNKNKVFYQDFLFDSINLDEQEYPDVELTYERIENPDIRIYLSKLMNIFTRQDWDKMSESLRRKTVVIYDDIKIINQEVLPYKMFYLKTYYYHLKDICTKCVISSVLSD